MRDRVRHAVIDLTEPAALTVPASSDPALGSTDVKINQAGELRSVRIESLRAIAAIGVLVGHVLVISAGVGPHYLSQVLLGGGLGVYLFFTLSGYLLFWPFARRDYGEGDSIDLRRYALNRALRILPLYYFVLVLLLIVQEDGGTLKQWFMFTTFSENYSTSTFASVDGVMWSLVVEIHFYILLPLIALGVARVAQGSLRRAAWALAGLGIASLIVRTAFFYLDPTPNLYIRYSILSLFFFFVSGMLLALLRIAWRERPPDWLKGPLASSTAWCCAASLLMLLVFTSYKRFEVLVPVASFLLLGACILPLRQGLIVRALEWRWLAAIGVVSYSLYLWHVRIAYEFVGAGPERPSFFFLIAVGGAASLAIAFLSYRCIEAPFLKLRRRWASSTPPRLDADVPTRPLAVRQPEDWS